MENPIIEKIKKLILHQKSAEEIGSLKEAEAFASKVQKLLNQYNISLEEISFEDLKESVIRVWMDCKIKSVSDTLGYFIMHPIAKYNWCRVYSGGKGKMCIVGTKENIEICEMIYNIVIPIFVSVGKKLHKESGSRKGLDTFQREFLNGCAKGLGEKFKAEQQTFILENVKSDGLILRNDKAVAEYVEEKMNVGKSKKRSVPNTGVYQQGVTTGKNTSINHQIK